MTIQELAKVVGDEQTARYAAYLAGKLIFDNLRVEDSFEGWRDVYSIPILHSEERGIALSKCRKALERAAEKAVTVEAAVEVHEAARIFERLGRDDYAPTPSKTREFVEGIQTQMAKRIEGIDKENPLSKEEWMSISQQSSESLSSWAWKKYVRLFPSFKERKRVYEGEQSRDRQGDALMACFLLAETSGDLMWVFKESTDEFIAREALKKLGALIT